MIDWTPVAVAVAGFAFSFAKIYGQRLIAAKMQKTEDAATLNRALDNALGAMQNAEEIGLRSHPLQSDDLHVTPAMAAGVQYAIDHATDEMTRLGVTPEAVAEKLAARQGLVKLGDARADAITGAALLYGQKAAGTPPPVPGTGDVGKTA